MTLNAIRQFKSYKRQELKEAKLAEFNGFLSVTPFLLSVWHKLNRQMRRVISAKYRDGILKVPDIDVLEREVQKLSPAAAKIYGDNIQGRIMDDWRNVIRSIK